MPLNPDISAAIDRIRALQAQGQKPKGPWQATDPIPYKAPAPQINVGELDTSSPLPPMDFPTEAQINTPVYSTGNETYGMGPQYTFTPPAPPSKSQRVAAAHQMRRKQFGQP